MDIARTPYGRLILVLLVVVFGFAGGSLLDTHAQPARLAQQPPTPTLILDEVTPTLTPVLDTNPCPDAPATGQRPTPTPVVETSCATPAAVK